MKTLFSVQRGIKLWILLNEASDCRTNQVYLESDSKIWFRLQYSSINQWCFTESPNALHWKGSHTSSNPNPPVTCRVNPHQIRLPSPSPIWPRMLPRRAHPQLLQATHASIFFATSQHRWQAQETQISYLECFYLSALTSGFAFLNNRKL